MNIVLQRMAVCFFATVVLVANAPAEDLFEPLVKSAPPRTDPLLPAISFDKLGPQTGGVAGLLCGQLKEQNVESCARYLSGFSNEASGGGIAWGSWKLHRGIAGVNANVITDGELIKKLGPILGNDLSPDRIGKLAPWTRRLSALPAIRHAPKVGLLIGAAVVGYEYFFDDVEPPEETNSALEGTIFEDINAPERTSPAASLLQQPSQPQAPN